MDFTVPTDHLEKIKENEKKKQILRSCPRTKKIWNMKVSVIPIVIGKPGTIPKDLVKELVEQEI